MWFIVSISAFFLLGFAVVIDKFLLTKTKIVPLTYAFYICLGGAILSAPLIYLNPDIRINLTDLLCLVLGGSTLFFGYYFMFLAVAKSEVSKANPLITCFIPLSVFILSIFLKLELISFRKIVGTCLVILAGYLLSQVGQKKTHLNLKTWSFIILASFLLGTSNIYSKVAYDHMTFISAFVWLRWFSLIGGIIFISLTNQWSELIIKRSANGVKQPLWPFIMGQSAGSIGTILLQYGIKLGNVILVTALNGIQFLFVIIFVYLISKFKPEILKEDIQYRFLAQKITLSLVLIAGVLLIIF